MILLVLLLVLVGIAVLEYKWASYALSSLSLSNSCDLALAEPGQTVTWSTTVDNYSRLPIPFARLVQNFPIEAEVLEDRDWKRAYYHKSLSFLAWYAEYRMTVRGRRGITRSVKLAFRRRGVYRIGAWQLSAGDLMGFRENIRHGEGKKVVVMPERSKQRTSLDALGGFLGDVSVRRFILEDPVLTVGFRDYTGREPLRAISWTRTAQSGSLQVKQYDYTAERHVVVLLNTEGADAAQLEECLRLTRSVCERLEQQKIPYAFRTNANLPGPVGKVHAMVEGLGQRHLNTILYGLGGADGTCFHSFRYMARQTLKKRKSSESYIVITPDDRAEAHRCIQMLSNAVGTQVCVLKACEGVAAA